MKPDDIEKYSCAVTLSDMEVFVFPELMYGLVLADIISPVIWQWRELDCFRKLENKDPYRKLMRLRQFIMDRYDFNLDLETWGLTSKKRELKRFEKYIRPQDIAKSNALFGYHGDRYYFDVDIRKHFGLDRYDDDIIPYWKTETVEAMEAFQLKPNYDKPAGECVSLAALYVAAAFIVCRIPLDNIYMILTPLHSQNFIDLRDGLLTNNRRLLTKTMWFNGTAISNKAQRALRNERVTIVAHNTGWIHCLYDHATIDKNSYLHFTNQLRSYLSTDLSLLSFASFLRSYQQYQKYFQVCRDCHGRPEFVKAETLFRYEHGSNYKIGDRTHDKLLAEVSDEDFFKYELPGRIRCDKFADFLNTEKPDLKTPRGKAALTRFLQPVVPDAAALVEQLVDFIRIEPKLPDPNKHYTPIPPVRLDPAHGRERIVESLQQARAANPVADLAFYAARDMETCRWAPFVKAAVERNPVSMKAAENMSIEQACNWLRQMPPASIYEGKRLAQPDEVANYNTADGLEKAFTLANIIHNRNPEQQIILTVENNDVGVEADRKYRFESAKNLRNQVRIPADTQAGA